MFAAGWEHTQAVAVVVHIMSGWSCWVVPKTSLTWQLRHCWWSTGHSKEKLQQHSKHLVTFFQRHSFDLQHFKAQTHI